MRFLRCWNKNVVVQGAVRLKDGYVHALIAVMHLSAMLHARAQPRLFLLSKSVRGCTLRLLLWVIEQLFYISLEYFAHHILWNLQLVKLGEDVLFAMAAKKDHYDRLGRVAEFGSVCMTRRNRMMYCSN